MSDFKTPTVQIVSGMTDEGYIVINAGDFDAETMQVYVAAQVPSAGKK